jgi:hypothetical protein
MRCGARLARTVGTAVTEHVLPAVCGVMRGSPAMRDGEGNDSQHTHETPNDRHIARGRQMRRTITLLTAVLLMLGLMGAPAMAWHQHTLNTPGTSKTFACEPEAAEDVHPIHYGLHMALDPTHAHSEQDRWLNNPNHTSHPGGLTVTTSACP